MKFIVRIATASLCFLALVVSAQAQPAPGTAVTGVPPFALGTPMRTVLGANPTLRPSTDVCVAQGQTTNYAGKVLAPIGGNSYTADILLCFYKGSLAAIRLTWPSSAFHASLEDWRSNSKALARQLAASYAPGLIKRNSFDEDLGGRVEIQDSQGNMLTMVSNATDGDTLSVILCYVAASYDHAVHGQPPTVGRY